MVGVASFIVRDPALFSKTRPYIWRGPPIAELPVSNTAFEEKVLDLVDVRTLPEDQKPKLETHGFCFIEHKSKTLEETTGDHNSAAHVAEMERYYKDLLGVDDCIGYNTRFRSSAQGLEGQVEVSIEPHIDIDKYGAWVPMEKPLTQEERDLVLSGKLRARIMNTWRPRVNHSEDFPLAVCDPHTLDFENDLLDTANVMPTYMVNVILLHHNPSHKWYWLSNQTPDEVVLFMQYDSHPVKGRFPKDFGHVPHTAFRNEDARPGCPPRQSIEARFILLEPAPYSPPVWKVQVVNDREPDQREAPYAEFSTCATAQTGSPPAKSKDNRGIVLGLYKGPKVTLKAAAVERPAVDAL